MDSLFVFSNKYRSLCRDYKLAL